VKLGLYFSFRGHPADPTGWAEIYRDSFAQIQLAEELGFDAAWLTEHHFVPDGYSPSVLPIAAAASALTSRIDIGTFVALVPLYHPVRLAEDAATIDVISNGRLILGLSAGYREAEYRGYGIAWDERPGRVDESLAILLKCWTEDHVSFHGKYFDLDDVSIFPKAVQLPHPRVHYGGVTPAGHRRGRLFAANRVKNIALRYLYVGETSEQAWADYERSATYVHQTYKQWAAEAGRREHAHNSVWDGDVRNDFIAGNPDEIAAVIEAAMASGGDGIVVDPEALGDVEHLVIGLALPGMPHEKVVASMRLFASEVMPRFRMGAEQ
jgi:alkanesulfonate monooxygenase SsuD/methylene tetrahydromethanopterin reductase-like flavin-dependent oxidoreductase (luciferase family)